MQTPARIAATAVLAASLAAGVTACGQGGAGGAAPAPDVSVRGTTAPATPRGAPAAMDRSAPTGLRIPAAGVDAHAMLRLGLDADHELEVPPVGRAEQPGWWTGSPTPGQQGAAVLVAHYDTARGPALLRNIAKVRAGDRIEVPRADGSTAAFEVREIQQVNKKDFPTNKVYAATDRPTLRLITCGGPIVDGHRSDNIVLFADLVGD
ncbi:class F sortase [Streptomyces longispororuber]|uniref:class F sortase n=1 Tax=Streptomyces longispororuber TaxID=68230 RepID=UPI00210CE382|nr:class F sortase [Streptomyces longispororuber]MCQ4208327.1 class F sortase [Streptomyces longispororuber]